MHKLFFGTQNLLNREISRFSAGLFLAATLAVLAGCGAGQALPSDPPAAAPGTAAAATAATIQLLAGSTQMPSSGATTVDLTAIVLDAKKQTVTGRTVTFSTGADPTAFVSNISASGVSDANGVVTAKLNLGSNKSNRTITISATADSASASSTVDVTGTTITISGSSSLAFGASTALSFTVKDSAANVLPNITVSVASQTGNTIVLAPTTGITPGSGLITATVTATKAGNDVITATAAGATATQNLTVSTASFTFTAPTAVAPATTIDIPLGTPKAVSVNWKNAGAAVVGSTVNFSIGRGAITATSVTNAAGDTPGVTITSATAGPATITASGPGGTPAATLDVIFVATSASNATVQAVPGTVQVTSGSAAQTNNRSIITAVVRDAANNLVKNASVSFNLVDPSGGSLQSSTGITDVSGITSVTYVAGPISSAQNGVTITATVNTVGGVAVVPAVTGTTNLTVSGQSLQVRLGTDNKVIVTPLPQNANTNTYLAVVTDAAGNPVVGTTVQFALRPARYQKGFFVPDSGNTRWVPFVTATCNNDDLNFNGILDPGESLVVFPTGVSPALRPGAVASVNATGVTDAAGIATATITYAKSYSLWTEVTLEARTSVTTNDPPTQTTFFLSGAAEDYTPLTTAPPPIPFGSSNSCFDTL